MCKQPCWHDAMSHVHWCVREQGCSHVRLLFEFKNSCLAFPVFCQLCADARASMCCPRCAGGGKELAQEVRSSASRGVHNSFIEMIGCAESSLLGGSEDRLGAQLCEPVASALGLYPDCIVVIDRQFFSGRDVSRCDEFERDVF